MSEEILKEKKDTLTINMQSLDYIKKYFLKNSFTSVFTLLALFSLIFWLSGSLGFSLKIGFLIQLTNLFSNGLWLFLGLTLILSSILAYYEKWKLMFLPILIWLLITTAIVRTSNIDGLVNAATGEPVLGPDLDPYLFLRNAIEISEGRNMGQFDEMRAAPLGGPSYIKGNLMPWAIFYTYKIANIFTEYSVTEAGIIAPVIFFLISLIGFFLFVYVLFSFKLSKNQSLTGATIASFLYAFVPAMLHRTIAGVPELESLGMVWFWFAFLFFALAWKHSFISSKKIKHFITNNKKLIIYGMLAGLFTGAMSWTWGGYKYIYLVIVLTSFLVFLFEKEKIKNFIIYISWFIPAIILEFLRRGLGAVTSITDSGLAIGFFLVIIANIILFSTKLKDKFKLEKIKLPEPIKTIIILLLVAILALLIISPSTLFGFFSDLIKRFFVPFGDTRVGTTVAENRTPYLKDALNSFGSLIWLFCFGLIFLFYEAIKHFEKKKKIGLNFFFIIFVSAFMFTSISSQHTLNGESMISKVFYLGGLIVFALFLIYTYSKAYKNKDKKTLEDFRKINISHIILLSFAFFGMMFLRTAIRFHFLATPALIIIATYLPIKAQESWKKSKDDLLKMFSILILIISVMLLISVAVSYTQSTIQSAKSIVPSPYYQQWHYAMDWVEKNTPEDAIFAHWWDYGYWVQTLGNRATVADGGHAGGQSRNHFLGRYMLTTSNPETALAFMNSLNITHLLIDSTDVGKYPAFSKIGSDETGKDRLSWIPVMPIDSDQTQEINNKTRILFTGGAAIDEDIVYTDNEGKQTFLPAERAGLAAISLEYDTQKNEVSLSQPIGIFIYNNQRYDIPLRYLYYNGEILDFGAGIESMARIIPGLSQSSEGISVNQIGAAIYLSEKTKDTLFAQLYLLDDPENKYPTITLAHLEDDFVVKSLKQQGLDLGDFVYYQGLRGPIKIWEVNYPKGTPRHEEYLPVYNFDKDNSFGRFDYLGV